VVGHLTEGLSANEQNLAISVKNGYDNPCKCSTFDQDAGFLGQPWKASTYHLIISSPSANPRYTVFAPLLEAPVAELDFAPAEAIPPPKPRPIPKLNSY
jgi:hypothetical protein